MQLQIYIVVAWVDGRSKGLEGKGIQKGGKEKRREERREGGRGTVVEVMK